MIKSKILFGLFTLLLGATVIPALGQTDAIADHIVINEIDINPPGDDSKSIAEWVELYNPTDLPIDIGGWSIASTTLLKKTLKIADGTSIGPDSYLLLSHQALWFPDVAEVVELRDKAGNVIDKTPKFTDLKNDFTSWQRTYDGYDTDTDTDWAFEFGTRGQSNGKLPIEEETTSVTVSIITDKENYIFGDIATITGKVSERVFVEKPYFQPAQIKVKISGANGFSKIITLFPDQNLSYKTTINLSKVLGFSGGEYTATVQYAEGSTSTKFSLGTQVVQVEEKEPGSLLVTAEKEAYLVGQFVTIKASTTDVIPLEGLKYKVINPEKQTVASGVLYPNAKGEFTGSVFMNTVKPVYGKYSITAEYSTYYAEATFDLVADLKEAKLITLKTDKVSYRPGEKVTVTGRLNTAWITSFDIEILQLGSPASAKEIRSGALTGNIQNQFKKSDVMRLAGDSTFSYEFTIPNGPERLGNYKITVSKDIGSEQIFFKVTEKAEEDAVSIEPLTLATDKASYDIGEKLVIFGSVFNLHARSSFEIPTVTMAFKDSNGKDVTFLGCPNLDKLLCRDPTKLTLTAVPNVAGDFRSDLKLSNEIFKPGTYTVKASFDQGKYTATTSFTISESVVIGVNDIIVSLDKKVYGLGEKVQLTGKVSESFPQKTLSITVTKPSGDTERHGVIINNQVFSWSWSVPSSENLAVQLGTDRSMSASIFGTYKIKVSSERDETNLFFRVSPNPDEDFVLDVPFVIKTNKAVYDAGEKLVVSGKTTKRPQATSGQIPERVQILVKSPQSKVIYESSVNPDVSGDFKQTFDMPVTVFKDGTYRVTASYFDLYDETSFQVNNNFVVGGDEPLALQMELDKEEYYPGEVVKATGRLNKLIFLEHFELTVLKEDPSAATCGAFYCGKGVPMVTVRPDKMGAFTYEFKIPDSPTSLGGYMMTADTDFGTVSKLFTVVEKPAVSEIPTETEKPVETEKQTETPTQKFFEKENRITESSIPITVSEKTVNDKIVQPRSIDGSLLTTKRGDEANVNIRVTTESGTCVIGPDTSCLVSESTRAPGTIYKIVEVDGVSYKVRYSGPDARLEKFTIIPELADAKITDSTWNVEILKSDEPSRFYYKVAYLPTA